MFISYLTPPTSFSMHEVAKQYRSPTAEILDKINRLVERQNKHNENLKVMCMSHTRKLFCGVRFAKPCYNSRVGSLDNELKLFPTKLVTIV